MAGLKVGHGRECITPPLGIRMVGYAARTEGARDVHDDLFVNAVAIHDGALRVALVAYDLCLLRSETAALLKAEIQKATGLAPEHVFLNTSHTHAGPAVGDRNGDGRLESAYREEVVQKSVQAVLGAMQDVAPATLSAGSAGLDIGCNRRERRPDGQIILGHNPGGPTLHELTVWRFARKASPDVVLFSAPMHGTTLGQQNLVLSAEWMGWAVHCFEEQDPDARAVFLQGCGADQDPYYSLVGGVRGTFEEVEQHGRAAAAAIRAALAGARALRARPVAVAVRTVPLPDKQEVSKHHDLVLHGLRLGDARLLALGCEAFVEYALFGRRTWPGRHVLVVGYTDGNIGYLCTADVFPEGGYEVNTTHVAPEGEQIVKDALKQLAAELSRRAHASRRP